LDVLTIIFLWSSCQWSA